MVRRISGGYFCRIERIDDESADGCMSTAVIRKFKVMCPGTSSQETHYIELGRAITKALEGGKR